MHQRMSSSDDDHNAGNNTPARLRTRAYNYQHSQY